VAQRVATRSTIQGLNYEIEHEAEPPRAVSGRRCQKLCHPDAELGFKVNYPDERVNIIRDDLKCRFESLPFR
jgi:hypothetical protein